jgi:hypothetical protein
MMETQQQVERLSCVSFFSNSTSFGLSCESPACAQTRGHRKGLFQRAISKAQTGHSIADTEPRILAHGMLIAQVPAVT